MCIHRKNKFIIHSYENPTYDEQRIRNSPLKMYLQYVLPYFSKPSKNIFQLHQSPSGPVYTRKTLQLFRIYKTVWFEHENTFQNYQGKTATCTIQNES